MNLPSGWMPVWVSQDRIRQQWLYSLIAADGLYAVLTLFGRSEGASQLLLRSVLPIGTTVWSLLLLCAAVLMLFGGSIPGATLGTLAWVILTSTTLVSIHNGTALSSAGPVLPGFMTWLHILVSYAVGSGLDADRERRQRGG